MITFIHLASIAYIVIKYYFETQNNILYVIGYQISKDFSPIWNFEDYINYFKLLLEKNKKDLGLSKLRYVRKPKIYKN